MAEETKKSVTLPQRGETLITAKGIGVQRSKRWLIRDIDIEVHRGEIVTLIGPNGGGKTTTARTLLGLVSPDEGRVWAKSGLKVGYVPQKIVINPSLPLTVGRLMTLTQHFTKDKVMEALAAVDMADFADAPVQTLSGGEFQRTLLARAIIRQPDVLILDEPVQGVDFTGEVALYDLIGKIRDELHCGIFLISHDLHIVMAKTDRVVCINGHVCCSGSAESVQLDPSYVELFGPNAAQTLALYRHHHDHIHHVDGSVEVVDDEDHGGHEHA